MSHQQQEEGEEAQQAAASASQEEHDGGHPETAMKINFLKEGLPMGIGFLPNEAELVHLLKLKIASNDVSTFDFYGCEAEDLSSPANANENIHRHDDGKVYVFAPREGKGGRGVIINQDTPNGRWISNGGWEITNGAGEKVAVSTFYTYYANVADDGRKYSLFRGKRKTRWIMRQFRLICRNEIADKIVLCVVYKSKSTR